MAKWPHKPAFTGLETDATHRLPLFSVRDSVTESGGVERVERPASRGCLFSFAGAASVRSLRFDPTFMVVPPVPR
jgi:hypothetical protein